MEPVGIIIGAVQDCVILVSLAGSFSHRFASSTSTISTVSENLRNSSRINKPDFHLGGTFHTSFWHALLPAV